MIVLEVIAVVGMIVKEYCPFSASLIGKKVTGSTRRGSAREVIVIVRRLVVDVFVD